MGDSDYGYQFGTGFGEEELNRLEAQGAALAPATRMILAEAGIRSDMRVLDLGCGPGDVTFVAAGQLAVDHVGQAPPQAAHRFHRGLALSDAVAVGAG